jgi:heptosyltransferase-1
MRLLLVKTSSMGDVLCAMPALTDAARALPQLETDWVVEEGFADLPAMHRAVDRVIPVALRRWRHRPGEALAERPVFLRALRARRYDRILDSQGLLKSAGIALAARGPAAGFDRRSAREPGAALAYRHRHAVPRERHAIERQRALFAAALGYGCPETAPEYGLLPPPPPLPQPYLVFAVETSWPSKRWPAAYWRQLIEMAAGPGAAICLPWLDEAQRDRLRPLTAGLPTVQLHPTPDGKALAALIGGARALVAPDTGAAHLAAACGVPAIVLYGSTSPDRTGTVGPGQVHLRAAFACSPCFGRDCSYRGPAVVTPGCYGTLPPDRVWASLQPLLADR